MPLDAPLVLTAHDADLDAWASGFARLSPERRVALWYGAVEAERPAALAGRLALSAAAARDLVASSVTAYGRAVVLAAESGLAAPAYGLATSLASGEALGLGASQRREVRSLIAAVVLGADGAAHLATLPRRARRAALVEAAPAVVVEQPRRLRLLVAGASAAALVTGVATGAIDLGTDTVPAVAASEPVGPAETSTSGGADAQQIEPTTDEAAQPAVVLAPERQPLAAVVPDPIGHDLAGGGSAVIEESAGGTPSEGPGEPAEPGDPADPEDATPVAVEVDQDTFQIRIVLTLPGVDPVVIETPVLTVR